MGLGSDSGVTSEWIWRTGQDVKVAPTERVVRAITEARVQEPTLGPQVGSRGRSP